MADMKVTLNIGCASGTQEDVIYIDDDELSKCNSEDEKTRLMHKEWLEWANDYIDGSYELIKPTHTEAVE